MWEEAQLRNSKAFAVAAVSVILIITMVITYHGGQCFKVSFGSTTLAFDPISKQSKLPPVKFGADIALVSIWHSDCNGVDQVTHAGKQPFLVDGPGEYEIGEVTVRGFETPSEFGDPGQLNTVYQVRLEDMNLLFLGALSDPTALDQSILGDIAEVDLLFTPIGGDTVLDVPQASKLAVKLEANLVIPMRYDDAVLSAFRKEEGVENAAPVEKLTVKKRDVASMSGEVAILSR